MLPLRFCERMKNILGDEYDAFISSLEEPSVRAVRVNTTKISPSDFLEKTSLKLEKIPYAKDGFIPQSADGIGTTPEHHAGMLYVQDPGAMATVNSLNVQPGWKVLDACAAPGGKASHLASLVGDEGFLLANEFVPKRAKIIVGNFERLGIKNAVVTSLDTAVFADMFSAYFDLVLCDAPCSGEGMFRKYDEALTEWSEENVQICAKRQTDILNNCAPLVKPGGYLLYSTCTYSKEENEDVVETFLASHSDFSLSPVKEEVAKYTTDGIGMEEARRFYPHVSRGEGQFVALLKRRENSDVLPTILYKEATKPLTKQEEAVARKFLSNTLSQKISPRLIKQGESVVMIFHDTPIPDRSVFMPGVMLGEIRKGMLFPHHQFFSAFGGSMRLCENIKKGDKRITAYLRGEEIESTLSENGWCAVCYEGVAIGGGKISGGRIKNHYPKGLRNK